jgi:hypothetical protein
MDPAGQGDHLPDVCRAQFIAMMRAFHVKIFGKVGVSPTQNSGTASRRPSRKSEHGFWPRKRRISKELFSVPAGEAYLSFEQQSGDSIPKGLRPPAQGCPDFSVLPWVHVRKRKQRQRCCGRGNRPAGTEWPQPRCGWEWLGTMTQGGSFLATLGFETESRWDSWTTH